MSLQTIRDGLVTTIVGQGKWAASQISSCDFGLMDLSASCVILQPGPGTSITPIALGTNTVRDKAKNWDISGMVFVKDEGNPETLLSRMWIACDDIYDSVNADDTLNGTADAAMITRISRPSIDAFVTDGNTDWAFIEFSVAAVEYEE